MNQHLEVHDIEEQWSRKIDNMLAERGYRPIRWARLCFTVTVIYTVLNLLVGLFRADFLNITVCVVAIYLLSNPSDVHKNSFRLLIFGTVVSLLYDLLWHAMQDVSAEDLADGGMQHGIRRFTVWMTNITMAFKVGMIFVFWKASLDFAAIIDERSNLFATR